MKKAIILLLSTLFAGTAFSCWYKAYNYEDYIYSVNNIEIHATDVKANGKKVIYTVTNNVVVDFPISVAVKLVSDEQVILDDSSSNIFSTNGTTTATKKMLKSGKLQYRKLSDNAWTTVSQFSVQTGSISSQYPPSFYFGRNNIQPKHCQAGDVIMIRVFLTDGFWESGDINSLCKDTTNTNLYETIENPINRESVCTLKNKLTFSPNEQAYNFTGNWSPCLVMTVIWSGKTRAIK